MKKVIFLLLLMYSMQTQAQTKEETISWLKEKLEKHCKLPDYCRLEFTGIRGVSFCVYKPSKPELNKKRIIVSDCSIKIEFKGGWNDTYAGDRNLVNNVEYYIEINLPTNGIISFDKWGPSYNALSVTVSGWVKNDYDDEYGVRKSVYRKQWSNEKLSSVSNFIEIQNGEPDIINRIGKALSHLVTFCPQKKEAF